MPPIDPPMTIPAMTIAGWRSVASPWILGTRKLFSTCWTANARARPASAPLDPVGRADEHDRDRRDDRADDRHQLEDAGDDRQQDREVGEHRGDAEQGDRLEADERRDADDQAEQQLATQPAGEHAVDDRRDAPGCPAATRPAARAWMRGDERRAGP